MNKLTFSFFAAAMGTALVAVPLSAEQIVVSRDTEATFVQEVSRDLDARLQQTNLPVRSSSTGIVKVRFRPGEDGRPMAVSTYQSSGSQALDRVAKRAVAGLSDLTRFPEGMNSSQVVQANIIFANSEAHQQRLARKLAKQEAIRMAQSDQERAVLAVANFSQPAS